MLFSNRCPSLSSLFIIAGFLSLLFTGCADAQTGAAKEMREWTDSTGQYKVVAAYGGVVDGNVKLLKQDGSIAYVPMEKFSDAVLNLDILYNLSNTSGWDEKLKPFLTRSVEEEYFRILAEVSIGLSGHLP